MTAPHKTITKAFRAIAVCTGILAFAFVLPAEPVSAADFDVMISRTFSVPASQDYVQVTERRIITNNTSGYFIPHTASETFVVQDFREGFDDDEYDMKIHSIAVTDGSGRSISYTASQEDTDIVINANYPSAVNPGGSVTLILTYNTPELIQKVGQVTNIHIPGLESDFDGITVNPQTGISTQIEYATELEIPNVMPRATFTLPEPEAVTETATHTVYSFSTESLIGTSAWHQIGTSQVYSFSIRQPVPVLDSFTPAQLSFLSRSKYSLLLPRDYEETQQRVYYTEITPRPNEAYIDDDGNVHAIFYMDTTTESEILVQGYITVELPDETGDLQASQRTLSEIDTVSMAPYLSPSEYWESDNPAIITKADELAGNSDVIIDILNADYAFIVNSIDYDDFKFGGRNERKGALATLYGGSSVCMEYSDLLIALARAQGIPARAAYGYGYDPKFSPTEQEEHQWVQAWIPDYGWVTIDPTWGETGRTFIGRDLDHALWYVASEHPDIPNPLEVISTNLDFELEQSIIEFSAVDALPDTETLMTINDLVEEIGTEDSTSTRIYRSIQTSYLGRALVILLPIICGILIIGFIISFITRVVRNIRQIRENANESRTAPPTPA